MLSAPGPVAPRASTRPSALGGFTIPPETKVMCNIFGAHRHQSYWERPLEFDPLRFNDAPTGEPVRLRPFVAEGFFPFGYGGHGCIGKNLAQEASCPRVPRVRHRLREEAGVAAGLGEVEEHVLHEGSAEQVVVPPRPTRAFLLSAGMPSKTRKRVYVYSLLCRLSVFRGYNIFLS